MKRITTPLVFILLLFPYCRPSEEPVYPFRTLFLSTEWYTLITPDSIGEVHLKIHVRSDAPRVTIDTYGDGIPGCKAISLDWANHYKDDIVVLFYHTWPGEKRKYETFFTAYESTDPPENPYCPAEGSGESFRTMLESPYLGFD